MYIYIHIYLSIYLSIYLYKYTYMYIAHLDPRRGPDGKCAVESE